MCNKGGAHMPCPKCHSALYCSKECLRKDKAHRKKECAKLANAKARAADAKYRAEQEALRAQCEWEQAAWRAAKRRSD